MWDLDIECCSCGDDNDDNDEGREQEVNPALWRVNYAPVESSTKGSKIRTPEYRPADVLAGQIAP
jgi:hypothetical protein